MRQILVCSVLQILITATAFAENVCYVQSQPFPDREAPAEICVSAIGLYNDGDHEWVEAFGDSLIQGSYQMDYSASPTVKAVRVAQVNDDGVVCGSSDMTTVRIGLPSRYSDSLSENNLKISVVIETVHDKCHSHPVEKEISYILK